MLAVTATCDDEQAPSAQVSPRASASGYCVGPDISPLRRPRGPGRLVDERSCVLHDKHLGHGGERAHLLEIRFESSGSWPLTRIRPPPEAVTAAKLTPLLQVIAHRADGEGTSRPPLPSCCAMKALTAC